MKPPRVLVTAGATEVPIDRVRAITNIFKGKTGTEISVAFAMAGYERRGASRDPTTSVTLLTSNPKLAEHTFSRASTNTEWPGPVLSIVPYRTFDDLEAHMAIELGPRLDDQQPYDVVIHSAAVSDYRVAGVHTRGGNGELVPLDASGKVGSSHERLFLELERTPKLIEAIRRDWGFQGKLIQFKLEVGITDEELIARARAALERSGGDLCAANCLEWAKESALLVDRDGHVERVDRAKLPAALIRWCTHVS